MRTVPSRRLGPPEARLRYDVLARRISFLLSIALVGVLLPSIEASAAVDRYMVKLAPNADPEDSARAHGNRYGVKADRFYHKVMRGYAADVPQARVDDLRKDPSVVAVMRNRTFRAAVCPVDSECLPTGVDRIDAEVTSLTGSGIEVAVLDSGINADHPDLAGNVAGGKDCVGPDTNNFEDDNGHGSHVAGTIAAIDNSVGVRGVAPGAKVWAVKILQGNTGTDENIFCGLEFVFENAVGNGGDIRIANMSIEASDPNADDGNCGLKNGDILHAAICDIVAAGVTFVAAAGNGFEDIKDIVPAAYNEVIAATALTDWDGEPCGQGPDPTAGVFPDDTFASFSNFATTQSDRAHTMGAPGIEILSTWTDPNQYEFSDGTSMAAPHIAGAAALYLQGHPNATPAQVLAALVESGEPIGVNAGKKCEGNTPSHTDPLGLHPEPVVCVVGCFLPPEAATPGVVRGIYWYLNNAFDSSADVPRFAYGNSTDRVLAGDWDDDGIDSPGVVRGNIWYLNNDRDGSGDVPAFAYGKASDRVIVGDWNGDGIDSPGVVRGNIWYLNNDRDGSADVPPFGFGNSADTPIVGDWDGDGDDDIGVRRGITWFLRLPGFSPHISFAYGNSTDRFVVGDWDGENP